MESRGTLFFGLLVLVALLAIVGLVAPIGTFEMLLWLALVGSWVGFWLARRHRATGSAPTR